MTRGDLVEATHMPHLGIGLIEGITATNRLLVTFEVDGRPYEDVFAPPELERARPRITRTA